MYNEYFGFSEAPFSIAPDPRYLFMSERHREALAHLLYGLRVDGGFVLLTGEVGTGKTTLCRCLLEQVPPDCDVAFVLNPKLDTVELLATLCDELHVPRREGETSVKALVDAVNHYLLAANAAGRKTVLIVDEAQNLSDAVLEQLRLLTNLETDRRKLLQIILLGQPELRERLAQPQMRQLAQRIVARYHLAPLSRHEVAAYVNHRLAVAGARQQLFPLAVIDRLHSLSGGTPRLINVICDRALLGAYVENRSAVTLPTLEKAGREVLGAPASSHAPGRAARLAAAAVIVAALGVGAAAAYRHYLAGPLLFDRAQPAGAPPAPAQPAAETDQPIQLAVTQAPGPSDGPPNDPGVAAFPAPAPDEHWLHEVVAVRAIFDRWGVAAPPVGIDGACRIAEAHGLRCLRRRQGTLDELRAMNGPAILALQAEGMAFYATLVELGENQARLVVAGRLFDVPTEVLERQWQRDYTVLWRLPQGWHRNIGEGTRGPDVAWVVAQLDRWEGRPGRESASDVFGPALTQRVRAFQRSLGLPDDGVIGPMTMVRLAALGDPDAPALARQAH